MTVSMYKPVLVVYLFVATEIRCIRKRNCFFSRAPQFFFFYIKRNV